ncbi:hypothetical protein Nmel_014029, partial [Mimus melanotis]
WLIHKIQDLSSEGSRGCRNIQTLRNVTLTSELQM